MTTIDHAAEARQHIEWARGRREVDHATIALAHATLALVAQQRTAILVAVAQGLTGEEDERVLRVVRDALSGDVARLLGIGGES